MKKSILLRLILTFLVPLVLILGISQSASAITYLKVSIGGTATASSYVESGTPDKAFDGNTTSEWVSEDGVPHWIQYELPSSEVVTRYVINTYDTEYSPKTWTFEGSNDGVNWITLDIKRNQTGSVDIIFDNATAYSYYRLYITKSNPYGKIYQVKIKELELYAVKPFLLYADPAGGIYNTPQNVTLTADESADIYYTLDGTEPTTSSTLYASPIPLSEYTTLKAMAIDVAGNQSTTITEIYTFDIVVINVTASPSGGYYNSEINISLTADQTADIYYTLDGSEPTASSILYTGPILLTPEMTVTLKAMAADSVGNQSATITENYVLDTTPPIVIISPPGGTYSNPIVLRIWSNELEASIYYTIDGTEPTTESTLYDPGNPISITTNTTVKVMAVDFAGNQGETFTEYYDLGITPLIVTATPPGGSYNTTQSVTLSANKPADIYYTIDGSDPTTSSKLYTKAISIRKDTTIKSMAIDTSGNQSAIFTDNYIIDKTAPTLSVSPAGGTYLNPQIVTLTANEPADIYYTTDGTDPTTDSIKYINPFYIAGTTTLKAMAVDLAGNQSSIITEEYIFIVMDDVDYGLYPDEQQGGGGLVGQTIRISNGNVIEFRSDLSFPTPNAAGLSLEAFYNSRTTASGSMGYGWTHTYELFLDPSFEIGGMTFLRIQDYTGRAHYFTEDTPDEYTGVFAEKTHVTYLSGEYIWHQLDGTNYVFSSSGNLIRIEDVNGNILQLTYNANNQLETVADNASGRTLTFTYNVEGFLDYVTGPVTDAVSDGIWVSYGYDLDNNLISVNYADGTGFDYFYTDSYGIHNLTEKQNRAGHLINTWGYDTDDMAISNFSRDGMGVDIVYESDTQVTVTDAYGKVREYFLINTNSSKRVSSIIDGPGGAGAFPWCSSNIVSWIYDSNINPLETESAGGTVTRFSNYDERGNPGSVTYAYATRDSRTVNYTYHPEISTPLTRTEASVLKKPGGLKETIWDYDDDYNSIPNEDPKANVSRIIEKGYTRDENNAIVSYEYITTMTYNSKGQVLTIDGPAPGTDDTTIFSYDPITGDAMSVTKPLVGATLYSGYDDAGLVNTVTDVNNQSKTYTYDARGRVTAITNNADSSVSSVSYNEAGLPWMQIDEDYVNTTFEYDTTYGRLFKRIDHQNNYIQYEYDSQGNVIEQGYYDSTGTLTNRKRFLYQDPDHDMPGLIYKEINPDDTFTRYGYDFEGNVSSVIDANGKSTYYYYDSLNRLTAVSQPGGVITEYGYDKHGNLISVLDAEYHNTTYEYDDMGRQISTTSPDTGTVKYVYDEEGNPLTKKDANGITVSYNYDVLNRLTHANFPDSDQNITYSYDEGVNGMGRRTGIVDQSGTMSFIYDEKGNLKDRINIITGITYTTTQTYTSAGRVSSVVYPTGRTVDYTRTACACSVDGVSTTFNGNTVTLMENIAYRPYGGAIGMDTGAGSTVNNIFSSSGRLEVANPGAQTERSYEYDNIGNITSYQVKNEPSKNRTYGYDGLYRLQSATGKYGVIGYIYDKVGNRLTKTRNSKTTTYNYYTGTNKLHEVIKGSVTTTYSYDDNGNIIGIGDKVFTFNQNNRLVMVEKNGITLGEYTYNVLGQRIIKTAYGTTTVFHYDFDGNMIGESGLDGTFTKEYLYKGDSRLALVDAGTGEVYFFMNDNLGTPQAITNTAGESVWEALYQPFGEAFIHPMSTVENNFRFKGQYYDQETGFHYNYLRYYKPSTGRYLRPDPIGLEGGLNLYAYVGNNPINLVDPTGLSGLAVDFGGAYGTGLGKENNSEGSAAGTGIFVGTRPNSMGHAQIGGYVYQSNANKVPGAKVGLGINLTFYKGDSIKFFKGKSLYKTLTLLFVSLTEYTDPNTCETTGWTVSLFGKGIGLTGIEKGTSYSWSSALQE